MYHVIYLDTLFFVNFFMDFCILHITAKILRYGTEHKTARKIGASAFGAVWVCITVALKLNGGIMKTVSCMTVPYLMSLIAEGRKGLKNRMKSIGVIYLVTVILGGIMHILYYYTIVGYFFNSCGFEMWMLAGGTVLCIPAAGKIAARVNRKMTVGEVLKNVVLENNGKKTAVTALADTGNSLKDPLYPGEPVSVAEADSLKNLIDSYEKCTYHLIPFRALGNENGIIPVVRLERLTIMEEKGSIHIDKPLVAVYTGKLSGGEYNMILHPETLREKNIIQGDNKNVFESNDAEKISVQNDTEL